MSAGTHPLAPILAQAGRLVSGVTTRWVDCAPEERQRIYYANHTSHLDFVVLWSSFPGHVRRWVRPVAAADYWCGSRFKRYLSCRVFNAVTVERLGIDDERSSQNIRSGRSLVPRLIEAMGENYSLIIFPEGTRGSGEEVAAFKSGIYHLCRARPQLELVPVYMENLNRVLPKAEMLLVPVLCSVTFGEPFHLGEGESRPEFLARARERLCALRASDGSAT